MIYDVCSREKDEAIENEEVSNSMVTLSDLLTNEKPDERQIMTYVSCYYHAFQGAMQVTCCNLNGCDITLCDLS